MAETQRYLLSDGTDLTPLFSFLTKENTRLRPEKDVTEDAPDTETEEFILAHVDLLPSEYIEQVKALLIPQITQKQPETPTLLPSVSYIFDELELSDSVEYTENGDVKAASLTKLVEIVTSSANPELNQVLLTTFPLYTTADALLELILSRLQVPIPKFMSPTERVYFTEMKLKEIHTRITAVLRQWIKLWPDSFRVGTHLFTQLGEFFPANRDFSVETNTRLLAKQLSSVQESHQCRSVFTEDRVPPAPILPKVLDYQTNPLLFWSTEELARQATLIDVNALRKIQITECLGRKWTQERGINAPNISRFSHRYGSRRARFIHSIVTEADPDHRIRLVTKLIDLAICCLDHFHNYETPWIIKGVLISDAVHLYLPVTMKEVLKKPSVKASYLRLLSLYDMQSFEAVKVEMNKHCAMPCWLAMRQDLYKIDLTSADFTPNGLINIQKHAKTAKIILKLREYQSKQMCFYRVAHCYNFLKAKNFAIDEKECERRAKSLER